MKARKGLILLFFVACSLLGVAQALPDFSKAQKYSNFEEFVYRENSTLVMKSACEVGKFDLTLYLEKEGIIYRVFDHEMICPDKSIGFSESDRKWISSSLSSPSLGHWYAVTNININGGCGLVFEFQVYEDSISRKEYNLPCN